MSETLAKHKVVKFGGKDVTVKELSMLNFGKVGKIIASVMDQKGIIEAFKSGVPAKQAMAIAKLLEVIPEKVTKIIEMSTGLKPEVVMAHGISEVVDLLIEVWHMNNFVDMFQKKMGGLMGSDSEAPTPEVAKNPSDSLTPPG